MKPELVQFGSANKDIKVVKINIDEKDGVDWKKYKSFMTSDSIPYTVILDAKNKKLGSFEGFKDAGEILAAVKATQPKRSKTK